MRELTQQEAVSLKNLSFAEQQGKSFDPRKQIDERFLYKVFWKRLRLVQDEKFTTAHLRVYLSLVLSDRPAYAVMWAWTVRNIYEEMYQSHVLEGEADRVIVGLDDWGWRFPEGIPTDEGMEEVWEKQKLAMPRNGNDNKLDDPSIWPVAGNIIEE